MRELHCRAQRRDYLLKAIDRMTREDLLELHDEMMGEDPYSEDDLMLRVDTLAPDEILIAREEYEFERDRLKDKKAN